MKLTSRILAGGVMLAASGSAFAADFYLCPPSAGGGCTDVFEQMTTYIASTSNYIDGNAGLGIAPDGGISVGDLVFDVGTGNVTGFQPFSFGDQTQAYGSSWILNASYSNLTQVVVAVDDSPLINVANNGDGIGQVGETVGVASAILSGTIDIYYQDTGAYGTQELAAQLQVESGGFVTAGNLVANLSVDFSNVTDTTLAQQLFWFDKDGGISWYDAWLENENSADPAAMLITARFDTNIDQLLVEAGTGNFDFMRSTDLDGSLRFDIPEPSTIALIGAGLLGAGFAARRRNRA